MEYNLKLSYRLWPRSAVPAEAAEPIDFLNRGVSVGGIARERLTAKRSRPEMAPQRLEKIESGPGNGMGSEASNPQDVVHGRGRARLRLTRRENDKNCARAVAEKGAQSFDFARCRTEIGTPARWAISGVRGPGLAGSRSRDEHGHAGKGTSFEGHPRAPRRRRNEPDTEIFLLATR
jgi:hypothetical protein